MKSVLIDLKTNKILNVIVADAIKDPAPKGTKLMAVPDNLSVDMSYSYDGKNFIAPQPFKSWVLIDGVWNPPKEKPKDNVNYDWDESTLSWVPIKERT